jgi:hypothetical protein
MKSDDGIILPSTRPLVLQVAVLLLLPAETIPQKSDDNWMVAVADSMTNVRRDFRPDNADALPTIAGVFLEMAKNKAEGTQLVVTAPATAAVHGLRWSVGQPAKLAELHKPGIKSLDLRDADGHIILGRIDLAPLGYIHDGPCPFDVTAAGCPPAMPVNCAFGTHASWANRSASSCTVTSAAHRSRGSAGCIGCSGAQGSQVENELDQLEPDTTGYGSSRQFDDRVNRWPFPLLDWINTTDVAAGSSQAIMLTLTTLPEIVAGRYTGAAELIDNAGIFVQLPLVIVVYDFQISVAQALPTFWGISIAQARGVYGNNWSAGDAGDWRFANLLLSHRLLAASSIYSKTWQPFSANASNLRKLWSRGQRWLNLGGLSDYQHCEGTTKAKSPCNMSATNPPDHQCCDLTHAVSCNMDCFNASDFGFPLSQIAQAYRQAMSAGWSANHTTVYLIDETPATHCFFCLATMATAAKRVAPGAKIVVVGENIWSLASIDAFGAKGILQPANFTFPHPAPLVSANGSIRAAAEVAGKHVGCYNSDGDMKVFALSTLAETAAVRARLLLGYTNWKLKTRGFLLWSLNNWRGSYFQDYSQNGSRLWVGRDMSTNLDLHDYRSALGHDGEGMSLLPGPPNSHYKGILSTLAFENMRDGLENYECLTLLAQLVADAHAQGLHTAAAHADAALVIPTTVLDTTLDDIQLTDTKSGDHLYTTGYPSRRMYTEDSVVVRAQWRTVARAIDRWQTTLRAAALKSDDVQISNECIRQPLNVSKCDVFQIIARQKTDDQAHGALPPFVTDAPTSKSVPPPSLHTGDDPANDEQSAARRVVCTNETDCTAELQVALFDTSVDHVIVPDRGRPWYTRPTTSGKQSLLINRSDLVVTLEPGVVIQAVRGAFQSGVLIRAVGARNLTIRGEGASLRMWRSDYANTSLYRHSEDRMGLSFYDCRNISVSGLEIAETGGDGVLIDSIVGGVFRNVTTDGAYRNGCAATAVSLYPPHSQCVTC